jgi:2-phospho-L-lactate guanylyltransferase
VDDPVALVPIRSFTGVMTRLSGSLTPEQRSHLASALASCVINAITDAGLRPIVITSAGDVLFWCEQMTIDTCEDPGTGLSGAARAGVSTVGLAPWLMIHSDLPLITPRAIENVAAVCASTPVIVPSYDGGTTVIASRGPFAFSYGIGSFQRHFASEPTATILCSPELSIDIDTERGLALVPELLKGAPHTAHKP